MRDDAAGAALWLRQPRRRQRCWQGGAGGTTLLGLARFVAYLRLRCGVASPIYERPGSHTLAFEFAMRLHNSSELTLLVQLVELRVSGLLYRSYVPPFVGDVLEREAASTAPKNLAQ